MYPCVSQGARTTTSPAVPPSRGRSLIAGLTTCKSTSRRQCRGLLTDDQVGRDLGDLVDLLHVQLFQRARVQRVIEIGVFGGDSSVRRAVTTMSWIPPSDAARLCGESVFGAPGRPMSDPAATCEKAGADPNAIAGHGRAAEQNVS